MRVTITQSFCEPTVHVWIEHDERPATNELYTYRSSFEATRAAKRMYQDYRQDATVESVELVYATRHYMCKR